MLLHLLIDTIFFYSPSNTALSSPEQLKEYLLTSGTCKCGLECHFKYDNTFNFDPKVSLVRFLNDFYVH